MQFPTRNINRYFKFLLDCLRMLAPRCLSVFGQCPLLLVEDPFQVLWLHEEQVRVWEAYLDLFGRCFGKLDDFLRGDPSTVREEIESLRKGLLQEHGNIMNSKKTIAIEDQLPIKETIRHLASFPRFSLVQKIAPKFYKHSSLASLEVARVIKESILAKNAMDKHFVLGLATGSTPLGVYKELVRMHKEGELSFKKVITFNLDEYYPIRKDDKESYNFYMRNNLFDHIDILPQNINIPNGELQQGEIIKYCADYELKIQKAGGIDLQILGIGKTGHIGFNEPPAPVDSITRLVHLHRLTRKDAALAFGGIDKVPRSAITMGISTIRRAKKIIMMAWSENKSYIVKRSIEGQASTQIPSTFLHNHQNATFYLDMAAGENLSRFNVPWIIKGDIQDPMVPNTRYWITQKVTWLAKKVGKSLLRLSFQDYEDNLLAPLVFECAKGQAQDLNLFVYNGLTRKITGWPLGGRPQPNQQAADQTLFKRVLQPKRVLIFSPHPDDDVISMGGTLNKLCEQGHQVFVAYMTSGTNAVYNYDVQKYLFFFKDLLNNLFQESLSNGTPQTKQALQRRLQTITQTLEDLQAKREEKSPLEQQTKRFIRASQAKIAIHHLGVPSRQVHCLNLPFYTSKSRIPTQEDIQIVKEIVTLIRPQAIFAAGDLTDPHGTHRKCLDILLKVFQHSKEQCPAPQQIFLYRGAWQEWDLSLSTMIIPLSPFQMSKKLAAILKHQSQKDNPMFPGDDKREFWQRSLQRNQQTAQKIKSLGLTEYEGAQCFVTLATFLNYDDS